jgi:plastocyanin
MKKTLGVILLLSCAGLALAVSVARPASTATALTGVVGPGFSITLMQDGTKVSNLAPGDYTITVQDNSAEHDFHLFGPGVSQTTSIDGTGSETWNVTFQNGDYTYVCDAHVASMIGKFTVGDVRTPTTPVPKPLKVTVSAKAKAKLVTVAAAATRAASFDVSLLKGTKRVAHATAKGTKVTLRLKAPKAGRYVAKVVAKAGGTTATAKATVVVK